MDGNGQVGQFCFSTSLKCEWSHDVNNRLLALSYHEKFVTKEIWEEAKALDARIKARISCQ